MQSAALKITGVEGVSQPLLRIVLEQADLDRFWSNVDVRGPEDCWPWIGSIGANGYGKIGIKGRFYTASRLAWFIANGEQPRGCVCHTCDNPPCCNPAHLWVGTILQNMRDAQKKGRYSNRGGCGGGTRALSDEQVQEIRRSTLPMRILAERFGVSSSTISNVRLGRNAYALATPSSGGQHDL